MEREYEEAFSEVDEVLKLMPIDLLSKIPVQFRKVISENKDTNYKVGYIGSNVKVTYDSKDSDPLEGTIEKESMKYIKLKIENTSIDATSVTLYSILENSTDTLPEGIKIISEE